MADGTRDEIFGDRALIERVGIRPPEIFAMGQALDPAALCYTIDDFLRCFEGRKPVLKRSISSRKISWTNCP